MRTGRRGALKLLAFGALAPAAVSPVIARTARAARPAREFRHGVASGDPSPTSVILWTRISAAADAAVDGTWTVALDPGLRRVVRRGGFSTGPHRDFTVKILADGLTPGVEYWYGFEANGAASPVGRTRTLPTGQLRDAVIVVTSCARYEAGLFNVYDAMSKLERVDAVVQLGDYMYERADHSSKDVSRSGAGLGRGLEPQHELQTLGDYRARHAQYKSDPDLQAAHARAPFICAWDDHETANNCWQGGSEDTLSLKAWSARKAVALKAYYEWMPIREPAPGRTAQAINRTFQFGSLASLILMETRLTARAHQLDYERDMTFLPGPDGQPTADYAAFRRRLEDPNRQMLGRAQEDWLQGELKASVGSGRPWQILGSQVPMARITGPDMKKVLGPWATQTILDALPEDIRTLLACRIDLFAYGAPYNLDSWDGYPAARERVYAACRSAGSRPIVVSGDSHAFWANELYDGGGERVGVEFGTTSVTSPGFSDRAPGVPLNRMVEGANREVMFCDQAAKGFVLLTLEPHQATADLLGVSTIRAKPYEVRRLKRYRVAAGAAELTAL